MKDDVLSFEEYESMIDDGSLDEDVVSNGTVIMADHPTLNEKIWNGDKLDERVKQGILDVVEAFKEDIEIPFKIIDIILVGSNAAYNYTDTSDLDVHIIADFTSISDGNSDIITILMNCLRNKFNSTYDINFNGINVELYVEDLKTNVTSNGIYSVLRNKWIKVPEHDMVPDIDISDELDPVRAEVIDALQSNNYQTICDTIDELYYQRKMSIQVGGEFGLGNLIFKQLRAEGLLDQLKEKRDQLKSKMLCIEHLEKNSRVKIIDKEGIVLYEGLEKNEPFGGYNWLFDTESGTYSCYLSDADIITKTIIEEA